MALRRRPATYFPSPHWCVPPDPFPLSPPHSGGQQSATSPPLVTAPPLNCIKVPQRNYDHGRRQSGFERSEPISFSVNGRVGINMGDALRKEFTGLDGRDDPVLQEAASAISCRLLVGLPWFLSNRSSDR